MTTDTLSHTPATPDSADGRLRAASIAFLGAEAACLGIYSVAREAGAAMTIPWPGRPGELMTLTASDAAMTAGLAALGATLLLAGLSRITRAATSVFWWSAAVVYAVVMVEIVFAPADDLTRLALGAISTACTAIVCGALTGLARWRRD